MTNVSMESASAETFSLTKSSSWRNTYINCTLAFALPTIGLEPTSVTGAHRGFSRVG